MTSESETPIDSKNEAANEAGDVSRIGAEVESGDVRGERGSESPATHGPVGTAGVEGTVEKSSDSGSGQGVGARYGSARVFSRSRPLPAKPRRVRAGVKLSRVEFDYPDSPTAARWLDLTFATVKPAIRDEAIEYARLGQAKRLELGPGRVVAPVQGRMPGAYTTRVDFETLSTKQWETVVDAMGAQAKFAATLIAGHLTEDLIMLFESLDSPLIPGAIQPSCTCAERRVAYEAANPDAVVSGSSAPAQIEDQGGWCKHSACLALLVADRLASEPLAILQLRGMAASEVMDRLHEIRASQTKPGPPTPVYTPVVKGASDVTYPKLEACLGDFWSSSSDPRELDFPVVAPEVSHPLLRRLGSSPFEDGKFPLVGILASCYDSISESILREERGGRADEIDELEESEDADGDEWCEDDD